MEDIWDVESDRDWNDFLLKSVIKGTGFPSNYIDASNDVDFARTVIMQNQLLVRKIISDQETLSEIMTNFVRKIYKYEYEKDIELNGKEDQDIKEQQSILDEIVNNIEVIYKAPVSLNLSNVNDQINNATQTLDFIMQSYFDDMQEDNKENKMKKLKFRRKIVERLIPSIDFDIYDDLYDKAGMETKEEILLMKTLKNTEDEFDEFGMGDDFSGGFDEYNNQNGDMNNQNVGMNQMEVPDFMGGNNNQNNQATNDQNNNQTMQGVENLNNSGAGLPPNGQEINPSENQ